MNENQIRQIVQNELKKSNARSRFGLQNTQFHKHTGLDGSPQIKQQDILPSVNVAGSIEFDGTGIYTINLNSSFTPSNIFAYGVVTDNIVTANRTRRCHTVGSAQLGPGSYLQPETANSVITGNIQYPFPTLQPDGSMPSVPIQGSSYISVTNSGTVTALTSQFHLVDIEDGSGIHARATVVGFSRSAVLISVPYLDANWQIIVNYVIT